MLKFAAYQNGQQVKKFSAASVDTIYHQFNRYCKSRGYKEVARTSLTESFGGVAWSNGADKLVLVKLGGERW